MTTMSTVWSPCCRQFTTVTTPSLSSHCREGDWWNTSFAVYTKHKPKSFGIFRSSLLTTIQQYILGFSPIMLALLGHHKLIRVRTSYTHVFHEYKSMTQPLYLSWAKNFVLWVQKSRLAAHVSVNLLGIIPRLATCMSHEYKHVHIFLMKLILVI